MRRTELVVRIMQACKNLQGLYDDEFLGQRRDSVRVRVAQAQKKSIREMSRQEFDAVVRSCARYQTLRQTPLRVISVQNAIIFHGGEITNVLQ